MTTSDSHSSQEQKDQTIQQRDEKRGIFRAVVPRCSCDVNHNHANNKLQLTQQNSQHRMGCSRVLVRTVSSRPVSLSGADSHLAHKVYHATPKLQSHHTRYSIAWSSGCFFHSSCLPGHRFISYLLSWNSKSPV